MTDKAFDYDSIGSNVGDASVLSWDSQARQYPPLDEPGIHYFRAELGDGRWVDCLMRYDDAGRLVGILNHYPQDIPPYESEGGINVWVHPERARQGIGSSLIMEALQRWELRGDPQRFSEGGARLAQAMVEKLTGSEYDFRVERSGE